MNAASQTRFSRAYLLAGLLALASMLEPAPCQVRENRPAPLALYPDQRDQQDKEQTDLFQRAIEQGKFFEVQSQILEYLKLHPSSWRAYYLLGFGLFQTRDRMRSMVALKKAIDLNPNHPESHKVLGLNFAILNRLDEAEMEMRRAAELLPNSAEIRYYLGRIYYSRSVFPLARLEFERAVSLDPMYVRAYDNLGLTYQALGNDAKAIECYENAIRLSEANGLQLEWPYINLASLYNRRNDADQALRNAQSAVKLNSRSEQAYFQMAKAFHSKAMWDQAIEALQKAVEINPRSFEYHYTLSQVYRRAGRNDESKKEMEIFMKLRSTTSSETKSNRTGDLPAAK